jgi:hypothetical protein
MAAGRVVDVDGANIAEKQERDLLVDFFLDYAKGNNRIVIQLLIAGSPPARFVHS